MSEEPTPALGALSEYEQADIDVKTRIADALDQLVTGLRTALERWGVELGQ